MRSSALNPKRATPRRNEGRVKHDRMRPKASRPPTAEQQRYHFWLRQKGRCQAGGTGDLVIHHLLDRAPGKRGRRDHWFVVLISTSNHNMGTKSVHLLGSEARFREETGVDLVAVAVGNLGEYRRANPA